jgi:hypothetical protein
VYLDAETKGIC